MKRLALVAAIIVTITFFAISQVEATVYIPDYFVTCGFCGYQLATQWGWYNETAPYYYAYYRSCGNCMIYWAWWTWACNTSIDDGVPCTCMNHYYTQVRQTFVNYVTVDHFTGQCRGFCGHNYDCWSYAGRGTVKGKSENTEGMCVDLKRKAIDFLKTPPLGPMIFAM